MKCAKCECLLNQVELLWRSLVDGQYPRKGDRHTCVNAENHHCCGRRWGHKTLVSKRRAGESSCRKCTTCLGRNWTSGQVVSCAVGEWGIVLLQETNNQLLHTLSFVCPHPSSTSWALAQQHLQLWHNITQPTSHYSLSFWLHKHDSAAGVCPGPQWTRPG